MAPDRPLPANSTIHPEFTAAAAAAADTRGRLCVLISGEADRSASVWSKYAGPAPSWSDDAVTASAFDPAFRIVLAAARECRVFGVTAKLMRDDPGTPDAWLARYATRDGTALDVDLQARGVRDDLAAWWWLAQKAEPVLTCDAAALDAATLFSVAGGPVFATAPAWRKPLAAHVKARARTRGAVVMYPYGDGTFWGLVLVAAPGLAGDLAREAVLREQISESDRLQGEQLDFSILGATEACTYWTGDITARSFEKSVVSTLKRGEKYPTIPRDAIRALAAAEGVAIAEGRGPVTRADTLAELSASYAGKLAAAADPVSEATIELAGRAVQAVIDAGVSERTRWVSAEARAAYRAEMEGLRKRLDAARAARRTRARAPNAVPVPALREVHPRPINWRTSWMHLMLDDAVALIGAVREETGATPLILLKDLSFRELASDWDAREMLSTIKGDPFDERTGEWAELESGKRVLVWWPDVSPRPVARAVGDGWEITSWGHAELALLGATPSRVLRSTWSHPTGGELKQEKFAGAGPWKDVDWSMLRRKVAAVMRLASDRLDAVAPVDLRDTLTLPAAAASARDGSRTLMGKWFYTEAALPE